MNRSISKPQGFISNFFAICAIFFGLLAAFSGADLPIISAVLGIVTIIYVLAKGQISKLIAANKKFFLVYLFLFALVGYMFFGHFSQGGKINDTIKYLSAEIILIPLFIYSISCANGLKAPKSAIIAGFGILEFLLAFEGIGHYRIYRLANPGTPDLSLEFNLGRAAYICLVLFWPALLAITKAGYDKKYLIAAIIITAYISTQFGIDLNYVIFGCVAFAAFVGSKFPKIIISAIYGTAIILIAGATKIYPTIGNYALNKFGASIPMSYGRRAQMWAFATDRIKEKPLFGWGLDGGRLFQEKIWYAGYQWPQLGNHPHSAPLHIWLEGGVVGAVLLIIVLLIAWWLSLKSSKFSGKDGWAYIGTIGTIMFAWSLSYSIWEQWLWATAIFTLGFVYVVAERGEVQKAQIDEFVEL